MTFEPKKMMTLSVFGLSAKAVDTVCATILDAISGYSTKGPICHPAASSDIFKLGKATKTHKRSIEIADIDRDCIELIRGIQLPRLISFDFSEGQL